MADPRNEVLDWSEQGRIPPGKLRAALEAAGALPSAAEWRRFLDRLDRKSTRLNSSHSRASRMPSSA